MRIRKARQILKAFSDDTRLRALNLLKREELTVTEICRILNRNQSIVSKHLSRLRLTGMVDDRRKGLNVYYYLTQSKDLSHARLVNSIIAGLSGLEKLKEDLRRLKDLKKKSKAR